MKNLLRSLAYTVAADEKPRERTSSDWRAGVPVSVAQSQSKDLSVREATGPALSSRPGSPSARRGAALSS